MGEVTSYKKEAIDLFIHDAVVVGSDLILTKGDGTTVTVDLSGVSSVTQADIDTAVANVVAGAPGALDTLNELAAALADDPNFATTMTTSLAGKADAADLTAETTARTNADALLIPLAQKGAASGVATLDGTTKVPTAQIPTITAAMVAADVATQAELDTAVAPTLPANNQTGITYTIVLSDAGKVVELNNAAAITLTIPDDATTNFPVGSIVELWEQGAGQVTVAPSAGVTLRSPGGLTKLYGQYSGGTLRKRAANEWTLQGDLA